MPHPMIFNFPTFFSTLTLAVIWFAWAMYRARIFRLTLSDEAQTQLNGIHKHNNFFENAVIYAPILLSYLIVQFTELPAEYCRLPLILMPLGRIFYGRKIIGEMKGTGFTNEQTKWTWQSNCILSAALSLIVLAVFLAK